MLVAIPMLIMQTFFMLYMLIFYVAKQLSKIINNYNFLLSSQKKGHTPSILKFKEFCFVLSQSSLSLIKFIDKNINI